MRYIPQPTHENYKGVSGVRSETESDRMRAGFAGESERSKWGWGPHPTQNTH